MSVEERQFKKKLLIFVQTQESKIPFKIPNVKNINDLTTWHLFYISLLLGKCILYAEFKREGESDINQLGLIDCSRRLLLH